MTVIVLKRSLPKRQAQRVEQQTPAALDAGDALAALREHARDYVDADIRYRRAMSRPKDGAVEQALTDKQTIERAFLDRLGLAR